MSEQELQLLGGKAKLWKALHPEVQGHCLNCPHVLDLSWCRTNPRLVYDVGKDKTVIFAGLLMEYYHEFGNCCCIEWVKYV